MGTRVGGPSFDPIAEAGAQDKLQDPLLEGACKALKDALHAGNAGACAEELLRLLALGAGPARIAVEIAAFDALHGEQGAGQALVLGADGLHLVGAEAKPEELALLLMHIAEAAMDASKHRAARRVPPSQDPGREPEAAGAKLAALVAAGDADAADGLMRGALWRKWGAEVVQPWLFELNAQHFYGGGRGLVLTLRALELLEAAGFEHARRILPGVVFALARLPREEEGEAWQWFQKRYAQLLPRLGELWERQGKRALADDERAQITRAALDGSREEAWHAVIGALASGGSLEDVIDALIRAASERLWRFDLARDADPASSDGWLEVGQLLLYMRALRQLAPRHPQPSLLRLVLFGLHAIHQLRRCDLPADRWLAVDSKRRLSVMDGEHMLLELEEAIRTRNAPGSERATLAYVAFGGQPAGLRRVLSKAVLQNLYARSEVTGHALSLIVTACELAGSLADGDRVWPLRGVIRMLASPVRERKLAALVRRAQDALLARPVAPAGEEPLMPRVGFESP